MVQGGREGGGGAKENRRMNGKTGFENYLIIGRHFFAGKKIKQIWIKGRKQICIFFTIFSHFPYFN